MEGGEGGQKGPCKMGTEMATTQQVSYYIVCNIEVEG